MHLHEALDYILSSTINQSFLFKNVNGNLDSFYTFQTICLLWAGICISNTDMWTIFWLLACVFLTLSRTGCSTFLQLVLHCEYWHNSAHCYFSQSRLLHKALPNWLIKSRHFENLNQGFIVCIHLVHNSANHHSLLNYLYKNEHISTVV